MLRSKMAWSRILGEKPRYYKLEKYIGDYKGALKIKKKLEKQFPDKIVEVRVPIFSFNDNEYNIIVK